MRPSNVRSKTIPLLMSVALLTACHGAFDELYDTPTESIDIREGQLYVDASSWLHWYYLDFNTANRNFAEGGTSSAFVQIAIPTEKIEELDGLDRLDGLEGLEGLENPESPALPGLYTYWYDVFGAGLSNHDFRGFTPTATQPEPDSWHIAVHRNNVRTNGGAAYETSYTSMSDLPESSEAFKDETFTPDEWNQLDVWTIQAQMLQGLIGNQGIEVNPVLSSWLRVDIPPVPPTFTLNNHVFIVRFPDNTYAAIQLQNYQSPAGIKCCLTLNYKYPY